MTNQNNPNSLLNRVSAQTQQNNAPAPQPPAPPASSRFGASSSNNQNNNNNQNNQNNNQNNNSGSRFNRPNPFRSNQNQVKWTTMPIYQAVVRFDLKGLGDPFYHLLGHDLNPDYGDLRTLCMALEAGGEHVEALTEVLNHTWETYMLKGAALVYPWNDKTWQNIATPSPMPNTGDNNNADDDDTDDNTPEKQQPPPYTTVRAIQVALVMNVLGRARSQLLLANAPLLLHRQYLERTLVTDDPRLVRLAMATGCLEEA